MSVVLAWKHERFALWLRIAFGGSGLFWGAAFTMLAGSAATFSLFLLGEALPHGGRAPTLNSVAFAADGVRGPR